MGFKYFDKTEEIEAGAQKPVQERVDDIHAALNDAFSNAVAIRTADDAGNDQRRRLMICINFMRKALDDLGLCHSASGGVRSDFFSIVADYRGGTHDQKKTR